MHARELADLLADSAIFALLDARKDQSGEETTKTKPSGERDLRLLLLVVVTSCAFGKRSDERMDFTNTPTQFIFPVLKSADILQCMTELDIEITKTELAEPQRHRDRLRKVFLKLVRTTLRGVMFQKLLVPP